MKHVACALLLATGTVFAPAWAQAAAPVVGSVGQVDSAAPAPAQPAGSVRSQSNGERAQVQPGNNAPMWRQVGQGVTGYSSLPKAQAPEAGNLVQPSVRYPGSRMTNAGEAWRQVRNQWILPYGAALLLIVLLALGLFYATKGPMGSEHADTGRRIERFTPLERAAHWANAFAFVVLALSGVVMAFGKFFLLPVLGSTLFGWLAFALKNVHNFMGPLFAVSLLIVILTFVKDNIPNRADLAWLMKGGGMFGGKEGDAPSHRFNAGEKGLFWWGITIPGVFVVLSGLVLDKLLPGLGELRGQMQVAHMVHAALALWMVALILGHIYMGTVGTRGAYKAMKTGYVSEGWAQEHHALWAEDIRAGKIAAQRSGTGADPQGAGRAAQAYEVTP